MTSYLSRSFRTRSRVAYSPTGRTSGHTVPSRGGGISTIAVGGYTAAMRED